MEFGGDGNPQVSWLDWGEPQDLFGLKACPKTGTGSEIESERHPSHGSCMRIHWLAWVAGLVLVAGAGCDGSKVHPVAPAPVGITSGIPANATPIYHLDRAQSKLPTLKLWVGPKELETEVCLTREQLATGLMFRPGIGENEGMLFVFGEPQQTAFYMKNVSFDIDAAYIDSEGTITEIVRLKKMDATPVPSKSYGIQFVLETAPGWFERNGIGVGGLVKTSKYSLREAFGIN